MPGFVGHERRDELSRGRHGEVDAERERHVERVDECNQTAFPLQFLLYALFRAARLRRLHPKLRDYVLELD